MNAGGVLLIGVGLLIFAQVLRGDALARLGVIT